VIDPQPSSLDAPDLAAINALPVLDTSILDSIRKLAGDTPAATPFLQVLATQYLEDAPKYLAQIDTALKTQDAPQLTRAAHNLRSSSTTLGGTQLASICKIVETLGRSQQLEVAKPYQQPLNDLAKVFQKALRQELLPDS
jgi:HPt (histidine-containing phosphotransfer) domain-containing protein